MSEVLTAEQLAEKLSVHPDTVRKLTRDGTLPHHRIGAGAIRYSLCDVLAKTVVNKHPDDDAVDRFAAAMHAKMTSARLKGKDGWDDPERCSNKNLESLFLQSYEHNEWVDVANYAMMLWARAEK